MRQLVITEVHMTTHVKMPPKLKRSKLGTRVNAYPRVVLQPFMADPTDQHRCHYTTEPATASLFNKPQYSDLKLKVGDECFYAHRIVLCAASEVFSAMLNNGWVESKTNELVLHEEGACAKVFDRFLYFCYSGSITISESYVLPLFTLADKYDVKPLYNECIKIIEQGLKVYVVHSAPSASVDEDGIGFSQNSASASSSSGDDSSSSDPFDSDDSASHEAPSTSFASNPAQATPLSPTKNTQTLRLIGSETFPISVVIKMTQMWQNTRLSNAALYNLEARIGNQILQDNYTNWSSLPQDLVIQMLADSHFCYGEFVLFQAAKAWLEHDSASRQSEDTISSVLGLIRYPLLEALELYEAERTPLVRASNLVKALVQEAIRYQLFHSFGTMEDKAKWTGSQFQPRKPRPR